MSGNTMLERRSRREGNLFSWSTLAIVMYTIVQIGRPQELFAWLSPYRMTLVTGVVTGVVALAEGRFGELRAVIRSREMRCVLVLLGLSLLSIQFSVWPSGSLDFLVNYYLKQIYYFVLLLAIVRSRTDLRRVLWAFVVSGLMLGMAAYLFRVGIVEGGRAGIEGDLDRLTVTGWYSANEMALVLVCALPFSLMFLRRAGVLTKLLLFGCIGLSVLGVIWSGSRTGFVALALVGVMMLIRSGWVLGRAAAVGMAVVLVFIMWSLSSSAYWGRIGAILNPETEYERNWSGRWDIWERGLNLIIERPVFGVGIGSFRTADGVINQYRGYQSAHNTFLEVWAELGPGGLVALCLLLWTALKRARHVRALYPTEWLGACATSAEISLASFLLGTFTLSLAYFPLLYLLVGIAFLCERVAMGQARSPIIQPALMKV